MQPQVRACWEGISSFPLIPYSFLFCLGSRYSLFLPLNFRLGFFGDFFDTSVYITLLSLLLWLHT